MLKEADNPHNVPLGSSGAISINNMPYMHPADLSPLADFLGKEQPKLHHTGCPQGHLLLYLQVKNMENYMIKENGCKNCPRKASVAVSQMFYDPLASNQ